MYNNDEKQYRSQGSYGYGYAAPEREQRSAADDFEKMLYASDEPETSYGAPDAYAAHKNAGASDFRTREEDGVFEEPQAEERVASDSTPGPTTMQFKATSLHDNPYEDYQDEVTERDDKRYRITTKSKVLIAVYAVVVAVIFTLIILNTRLLKNMNARISSQQSEIQILRDAGEKLKSELEFVSSDEEVERRAAELGYVKAAD